MWNLSSSLADSLFAWSNVILIVGAALVLMGTIGAIKLGAIREHFADIRISDNERETQRAKLETEKAKLETEKLKKEVSWRDIMPSQSDKLDALLRGKSIQLVFHWGAGDAEGSHFAHRLAEALAKAGQQVIGGGPIGQLGQERHGLSVAGYKQEEVDTISGALTEIGLGPIEKEVVPPPQNPQAAGQYTGIFVGYRVAPKL